VELTGRALLRSCLRRARRELRLSMASSFVRQLAFLALPLLLGRAVQDVVAEGDTGRLPLYLAVLTAAVLVEFAGLCGWMWWANLAEARLAAELREDLLDTVLRTDAAAVGSVTEGYGDLLSRAVDDVDAILLWVHGLATWIVIATTVVVLVPSIASIDPALLAVAGGCAAALVVVNLVLPPRFSARLGVFAVAQAERTRVVEQLVSAHATLRGVGGEVVLVRRHAERSAGVARAALGVARVRALWTAAGDALPFAGIAVGLAVGGLAAVDGRMDVGQLTTFTLWMGTVQLAANAVVERLGDHGSARVSADRIAAVLALSPRVRSAPATGNGPLELHRVAVARAAPVSLTLAPGQWGVLTGPTGAGKSTLLRAVAGLEEHAGEVRWRGGVALVPQAPLLLHGTVRENLCLGAGPVADGEPSDDVLRAVCRTAGLDPVLARLRDGLQTVVGERGSTLSGGERQRLALARALVREAPLLLLDDVTSGLDPATEAVVLDRLREATRSRVVLWASHREAVRHRADVVAEMAAADRTGEVVA
jgi:ATP-binding cassette subfamily B protein